MEQMVNREEFLGQLQSVTPGLSKRAIIEQSDHLIFKDGKVFTYNDEIACVQKSIVDFTGAIKATPLISILSKLAVKDFWIDVKYNEFVIRNGHWDIQYCGKLIIKGHNFRYYFYIEEIALPIKKLDRANGWKDLPDNFDEAISYVLPCAGDKMSQFNTVCIHIHPKFIEATDNHQAARLIKNIKRFLIKNPTILQNWQELKR